MGKPAISFATGEQIKTGANSKKFRSNWDDIFKSKEKKADAKEKNNEPKSNGVS